MTAQSTASQTTEVAPSKAPNERELDFRKQEQVFKQALDVEKQARLRAEAMLAEKSKAAPVREDEESDEPYVDHRTLDKKLKKWEENLDERIEKKAEEKARQLVAEERRTIYMKSNADFHTVMSEENLQRLMDKHPALAEGMLNMPDGFERQKLVYETIKSLKLHQKEEKAPSIQDKIDANRRSPYYQPSGIATNPYASVGDFSDAGKKNAYQKLQELKKNLRM